MSKPVLFISQSTLYATGRECRLTLQRDTSRGVTPEVTNSTPASRTCWGAVRRAPGGGPARRGTGTPAAARRTGRPPPAAGPRRATRRRGGPRAGAAPRRCRRAGPPWPRAGPRQDPRGEGRVVDTQPSAPRPPWLTGLWERSRGVSGDPCWGGGEGHFWNPKLCRGFQGSARQPKGGGAGLKLPSGALVLPWSGWPSVGAVRVRGGPRAENRVPAGPRPRGRGTAAHPRWRPPRTP